MDWDLMERIIDKIASENPHAIVFLYGNSEPFLHPRLPEVIQAVNKRGLHCEMSTNLNYVHHVDEVLAARPDFIIISLSGFTQEVYEKGHAGGKIDKVKANMEVISAALGRCANPPKVSVNYHIYKDNEHELPLMKQYAENLGIGFFTSFARAISMENAIRYCQSKDPGATEFEVQEGRNDWNTAFPPVGETYVKTMDRLLIPPTMARDMYADMPDYPVCPVSAGGMFSFIRHTGEIQLCACTADRRITLGNYLDLSTDQMRSSARGHSVCKQCSKYKLRYYFHITKRDLWR
jgi:MoaA/NifB/PqqE/SkfB family radical SAM enzyme